MSRRDILIPPLTDADGQTAAVTIGVGLIDAAGAPLIGYTTDEGIIEPFTVTADDEGTTLALVPQSEIYGETYYQLNLASAHRRASHRFQVPAGDTAIPLQDLLALADPVDPGDPLYARLLPDPTALPDGKWVTTLNHEWIGTDAPPGSGVPEAPLTGLLYGRQGGAWVDLTGALTVTAGATVSGHRAIALNLEGQGIYADASDATALAVSGISTGAALLGDPVTVQHSGHLAWPAGGLTPGVPLFLGATGLLTQVVPTTGWLRQVAMAIDASSVLVDIGPAIDLGT